MQESYKVKAKARRSFSFTHGYAPGDNFEGTEEQVKVLVAQGNLDITSVVGAENPEFKAEIEKAKKAETK